MEYREIDIEIGSTIDDMVEILISFKKRGELVSAEFNGHTFYSDSITLDMAYKEITGVSKQEFDSFVSDTERKATSNLKK